jgi:RNA polymerase sigma-70 factor (sigma-E family)
VNTPHSGTVNAPQGGAVDPLGSPGPPDDPRDAVIGLYRTHVLGLTRLAVVMLGDRPAAEDVVQDAFCGLYTHWWRLSDPAKALPYLRTSVLNGCRNHRRRRRRAGREAAGWAGWDSADSAESSVLLAEEHREVLGALQRLPARQREALVLRFYLDLAEPEIARIMGISQGTVKSTTSRGLAALGRILREKK